MPIAFSYVFCMKCRKSGAFAPQKCIRYSTNFVGSVPPRIFLAAPKRPHEMQPPRFRAEDLDGRTAQRFSRCSFSTNKKGRSFRNALFVGGDKRDRTADLMTASCDRFVISGDFEYNTSVPPAKSAGFCSALRIVSTRIHAHLGQNLGQGRQVNSEEFLRRGHGL